MKHLLSSAVLLMGLNGLASANVIYGNNTGVGNQHFTGSLGMDFQVNSTITITHLGAFDSGQNGFSGSILIQLFDLGNLASPLVFTSTGTGEAGTLLGGSRFFAIAPITLNAGFQGSIVASGYSSAEPNGNASLPSFGGNTTDNLGGAISFIGSSRYGNTPGVFPTTLDSGPENRYQAGTFMAVAGASTATPEPGTWSLIAMGGVLIGAARLKRS